MRTTKSISELWEESQGLLIFASGLAVFAIGCFFLYVRADKFIARRELLKETTRKLSSMKPFEERERDAALIGRIREMIVEIDGFRNDYGSCIVTLWDDAINFHEQVKPKATGKLKIEEGFATWTLRVPGDQVFAIKAFHDEDNDGILDTSGYGRPLESYGFTNQVASADGRPDYALVRVDRAKLDPSKPVFVRLLSQREHADRIERDRLEKLAEQEKDDANPEAAGDRSP